MPTQTSSEKTKQITPTQRKIRLFFTGLTMGLADLVPGVSGGTIAFLFGIYDELLYTIRLITGQVPKLLLKGQFRNAYQIIPFGFILPLVTGAAVVILGLVRVITYLLDTQPMYVWAFFFGLVVGSVYIISRRVDHWTLQRGLLLFIGFILTFLLVGLPSIGGSEAPLAIFGTGVIAITAMILPGISGSLIMVLLGQYEIIVTAVAERDIVTMALFSAGALVGLALFVRVLTWLLKHYHFAVIALLIGVMIGSLRRVWPWQITEYDGTVINFIPQISGMVVAAVILMVIGFVVVLVLERIGIAKEHTHDITTANYNADR